MSNKYVINTFSSTKHQMTKFTNIKLLEYSDICDFFKDNMRKKAHWILENL